MRKYIVLTIKAWKSGKHFIAYNPELDVASQGRSEPEANKNLHEAVQLFLETARKRGTLNEILQSSGLAIGKKPTEPKISFYPLEVRV